MTAVSDPPQQAFDLARLVHQHQADVWRYLRYLGASTEDADDLTQETFLAVGRTPLEERSRGETAGYLRTAARNQLFMLRRRQGRQVGTVDLAAAEEVWAAATTEGALNEFLDALSQCYETLTGRSREASHLALHGWWHVAHRHVRLQATARKDARTVDAGIDHRWPTNCPIAGPKAELFWPSTSLPNLGPVGDFDQLDLTSTGQSLRG